MLGMQRSVVQILLGPVFFLMGNILFQINLSDSYSFVDLVAISSNCFFFCSGPVLNGAFISRFTCKFTYFDYVFHFLFCFT